MFGWSLKKMSVQEQLAYELVNLSVPKIHLKIYRLSKQFDFPYDIDVIRHQEDDLPLNSPAITDKYGL